ncbi:hypothetical protein ACFWOX_32150 [Streptomyces sp. NPDC058467]|uniref:hypothetical protein n=1 Tax=Streptomyces sp. NPDC058467 TaxID=3346513 RepID=UPI003657373F
MREQVSAERGVTVRELPAAFNTVVVAPVGSVGVLRRRGDSAGCGTVVVSGHVNCSAGRPG